MGSSHSRLNLRLNLRRSSKRTNNDEASTSGDRRQKCSKKKSKRKGICTIDDLLPRSSNIVSEKIDDNNQVSCSPSQEYTIETIDQLYPRLKTPLIKRQAGTESCDGGPVRRYPTESRRRGPVFIINNFFGIDGFEYRRGSCNDVGKLETAFKELKFTVHDCEMNLAAEKMREKCEDWARRDFSDIDCVVMVILTHGGDNGVLKGVDNKPIELLKLISPFYADSSPTLIGKPKIFIIQACRGVRYSEGVEEQSDSKTSTAVNDRGECSDEDFWEVAKNDNRLEIVDDNGEDATNFEVENVVNSGFLPRNADVVVAYSCTEGEKAFRDEASGSSYIKELIKALERSHKDKIHFTDILTEVQGVMSNFTTRNEDSNVTYVQMPAFRSTLRGPLYLY